jgi:iron complex transport system ATP-binding protein
MYLSFTALTHFYGKRQTLAGITAGVSSGTILSLIGENGSGKSTLLMCLAGILNIAGGSITIDGRDLSAIPDQERAKLIAIVPQRVHVTDSIRVFDTVIMGRKPYFHYRESNHDLRMTEEALRSCGIEHLAFRKMGSLSGGEKQKVFIARAIAQATPILILDEPLNSLDLRYQIAVLDLLKRKASDDRLIVIMAIHDVNLALRCSDAVLLLKQGNQVAIGDPKTTLTEKTIEEVLSIGCRITEAFGNRIVVPD